jgi:hypothetical protein
VVVLGRRTEVDTPNRTAFGHTPDVSRTNLGERLSVGVRNIDPRSQENRVVCEFRNPDRRLWLCEDMGVLLGFLRRIRVVSSISSS